MNYYQKLAKAFFNNQSGKPYNLSVGQSEIFRLIYDHQIRRVAIKAATQYGKSDVTAMAILTICMERAEKVAIIAPKTEQAQIIMSYVIQHIFDNNIIISALEFEGSLDRLRQERSKKRLTFKHGSEIRVLTADVRTMSKEGRGLMGFGANTIVVDEAALIPDQIWSKAFRMVGGRKSGKIVKLANPFEQNHFYKSFNSKRYESLSINWQQAVAEGRFTKEFIDEAREELTPTEFRIFYDCEFPEEGAENALIPYSWLEHATDQGGLGGDKTQVGLDVARYGRDKTVYCFRRGGNVVRTEVTQKLDTMEVVGWLKGLLAEDKPDTVAIDVVGIGAGVYDRMKELPNKTFQLAAINGGEKAVDHDQYFNRRSEMFWNLRNLFAINDGRSQISIPNDPELKRELSELRYQFSSERKKRLENKEDMKRRIGQSPDKADALALAFIKLTPVEPKVMIF